MAKVLGESGRYVSQEASLQTRRILVLVLSVIALLALIEGAIVASFVPVGLIPAWLRLLLMIGVFPAIWLVDRTARKRLDELDRKRTAYRRGASGEIAVGLLLGDLPDDCNVINDLTTPFGNLDHVVVGPPGVFVLDTKNWRGLVAAGTDGELVLNGKRTDKPEIRNFVARVMSIREKVTVLAPGVDCYFNALFVFTAARVEAKWGATGKVHCIRDDQLHDYIIDFKPRRRLTAEEVTKLAQAFLGLAHMDTEFGAAVDQPAQKATALRGPVR